jgi:ComF family protein
VGDSAATLYFLLIASIVNVLLDLLFVAVFHWGVAGAAAATNISQALAVLAAWCYMQKKYPIFRFKYKGRQEYGAYYGRCMAQKLFGNGSAAPWKPDLLVPVPVSAQRLRKRGYNQALILAREISRLTGIPMCENALRRVTDTLPMKNMTPAERQNNLKKAFQAFGNDVELNSIMLIDDIYTTGATMDACAHALYRQGARRVCFITLAAGVDSGC